MVKEFRVVLAPPLQNGYITNSEVTGHVVLVTDEAKSGYKAIEVTLKGYATVRWTETIGTGENRRTNTYYSHEVYIANTAVLWSKDSAPGGQIAANWALISTQVAGLPAVALPSWADSDLPCDH